VLSNINGAGRWLDPVHLIPCVCRTDGTLSYYFSTEDLTRRCEEVGFHCEEVKYARVQLVNRSSQKTMHRVFVQGRFVKPSTASGSSCALPDKPPDATVLITLERVRAGSTALDSSNAPETLPLVRE
jgi:hypothetical protein